MVTPVKWNKKNHAEYVSADKAKMQAKMEAPVPPGTVSGSEKRFRLLDGFEDVLGGDVSEENVYIKTYGSVLAGEKLVSELAAGEHTFKRYALSGQRPTTYKILRVA